MATAEPTAKRARKIRTFRIDTCPVLKGKDPDYKNGDWKELETASSRDDAAKMVALSRKLDKEPRHYAIAEIIETGGRQPA